MDPQQIEQYLCSLLKQPVKVHALTQLGSEPAASGIKSYGYGTPLRIDYETASGEHHRAVLHTVGAGSFGHEHMPDRARLLLEQHRAFNRLPGTFRRSTLAASRARETWFHWEGSKNSGFSPNMPKAFATPAIWNGFRPTASLAKSISPAPMPCAII